MKKSCVFFFVCLLSLVFLSPSYGWSGREHYWINLAACLHLERDMPGFKAYGRTLAEMGHYPDLWKDLDPDEDNRHYIDLEEYGYPNLQISQDHVGLLDEETGLYVPTEGIAPWVIMDLLAVLTEAMTQTNWTRATEVAAAMGHYVGDTHMPLHTTANFNGQLSGNMGVHTRWESQMPRTNKHSRYIETRPVAYLDNPWSTITNWIIAAHQHVTPIMDADTMAMEYTGGDSTSEEYFNILWEETKGIFAGQRNQSAQDLASLWYTAWVDAGKPPIPAPPEQVSEASIFSVAAAPKRQYTSWVFLGVFILAVVAVVWKSMNQPKRHAKIRN